MKAHKLERFIFILLITVACGHLGTVKAENDCIVDQFTYICGNNIPIEVPNNVSGVIIKDYSVAVISNETFANPSWSSIKNLDITFTDNVRFSPQGRTFTLPNLQILGIHSPGWRYRNNSDCVFEGLDSLKTLNLSFCHNLNAADIVTLLTTVNQSLDTLILDQLAISDERFLYFNDAFIKTVKEKDVRRLSLSGCNLFVRSPFIVRYPLTSLIDFDLSNTTIVFTGSEFITDILTEELLPNLQIVDLSFLGNRFLSLNMQFLNNVFTTNSCFRNNGFINLLLKVEHIKFNNILLGNLTGNNTSINFTMCETNVRSVELRSNNLRYLNVTILWPVNTKSTEIDLSSNELEYLSPRFLGSITSLEIIKLSDNKLYLMEMFKVFEDLFTTHKELRHLDLSLNQLTVLPFGILRNNINLVTLDLSFNSLTSVGVSLKHLVKLQFLNFRDNHLLFIDSKELNGLEMLIANSSHRLEIDFKNNPFKCTCESVSFMKWLHVYSRNTPDKSPKCTYNDKDDVVVNTSLLKKVEFSCIRSKIIIISVTTVVGCLMIVSMVTIFVLYKKRQQDRKRKRGNFIKDFKLGSLSEKYLCFVSYSSDDDESQIKRISAHIKETLQEMIHTDREVMCENSEHFNIGFPIIDEVMRCIVESCVGIFFVTNNFCQSRWCELELRETYDLKKPIILIFKEEIDERNMSSLMLNIFRKFTRAKIVKDEYGQIEMIPDVKQFSNSIIKLASSRYDENIENIENDLILINL